MPYFHDDGHLSDGALRAVLGGTLNELERLEVAEHLSFCDGCLLRYTALLADEDLEQPRAPLAPGVLRCIRGRVTRILFNRYTTAAAAACLAVALWGSGLLGALAGALAPGRPETPPAQTQPAPTLTDHLNTVNGSLAGAFNGLISGLADPIPNPANLRTERDSVFAAAPRPAIPPPAATATEPDASVSPSPSHS